jgi:hypothetical protein
MASKASVIAGGLAGFMLVSTQDFAQRLPVYLGSLLLFPALGYLLGWTLPRKVFLLREPLPWAGQARSAAALAGAILAGFSILSLTVCLHPAKVSPFELLSAGMASALGSAFMSLLFGGSMSRSELMSSSKAANYPDRAFAIGLSLSVFDALKDASKDASRISASKAVEELVWTSLPVTMALTVAVWLFVKLRPIRHDAPQPGTVASSEPGPSDGRIV